MNITDILFWLTAMTATVLASGSNGENELNTMIAKVIEGGIIWTLGVWVTKAMLSKT